MVGKINHICGVAGVWELLKNWRFLILWRNRDFFNCFGHIPWMGLAEEFIEKKTKNSHPIRCCTRWLGGGWGKPKATNMELQCWRRTRERGFLASAKNHVVAAEITLFNMEKCLSWLNAGMCRPRVCLPCQAQLFARAGASQSCLCLFCFTTASPTTITATPTPIATAAATASTAAASYCCCYCYFFRCDY